MRVLHVIPSLSPSSGGPSFALPAIARSLQSHGVQVHVATTDDDGPGRRKAGISPGQEIPQEGGWTVRYFPKQTEFYKVSLPLRRWLREHAADYDVVHVHALFSFASLAGARAALGSHVPYIIRPLGVLNRWGMENRRRWAKALSFRMLELPLLKRAAAVHYTSRMELEDAARFGLGNRQTVIPLGIDLAPFDTLPPAAMFGRAFPEVAATRNLLFLSRVDVKKGLDLLIAAFGLIAPKHADLRLIICGEGDPTLLAALRQQAEVLGLKGRITWAGQVSGEMRLAAFAAAEMFVLPSHSENFGIALLEAMAADLPCISTDQVALAVDAARVSAVMIAQQDPPRLAQAIEELLASETKRQQLSQAARRLAREDYSLEAMGRGLYRLYQDVTHGSVTSTSE
jgi:glycosyltransferase involved in cell wall biosynthesis